MTCRERECWQGITKVKTCEEGSLMKVMALEEVAMDGYNSQAEDGG